MNIPEGFERVPFNATTIIKSDWKCDWDCHHWLPTANAGKSMDPTSSINYIRPIRPSEAIACPYCGGKMQVRFDEGKAHGACFDCDYTTPTKDTVAEVVAVIKRTRIEPEPLVCPRCGGSVNNSPSNGNEFQVYCGATKGVSCGIRGPWMPTQAEAESEFRKLGYRKG